MKRLWWPLLILAICLPVALLALDVPLPGVSGGGARAKPLAVPDGDHELAYLHTTTNANTWERLVTGLMRVPDRVPGLTVDDRDAFLDSTTAVPELVICREGHPGKLRVRWYKLNRDATTADWIEALAARRPAPLAVVGGGSTDRAVDLANAMRSNATWHGARPALFITTATADEILTADGNPRLVDVYDDRTFRFCFTNRQMADAVLDFTFNTPDLSPADFTDVGPRAAFPQLKPRGDFRPNVQSVVWNDDPYSVDLQSQFGAALRDRFAARRDAYDYQQLRMAYSVGGSLRPNADEAVNAAGVADTLRNLPPQRSLLVLPAVTQPARRFLRATIEAHPDATRHLVVVTGDGISVNAILRDGEFAWPVGLLNVPLVLFTHANPVAWDAGPHPSGYTFSPPNSTEEAAHFTRMGRVVAEACLPLDGTTVRDSDDLIARLRARTPAFFDPNGERLGGTGEFVVVVRPRERSPTGVAEVSVWRRNSRAQWVLVRAVPVATAGVSP